MWTQTALYMPGPLWCRLGKLCIPEEACSVAREIYVGLRRLLVWTVCNIRHVMEREKMCVLK
jgi:hypothetical protein